MHIIDYVACAENTSSVLVLTRAWAIWGTRKRVTKILIMGYIGYVLMLIAVATNGINNKHGIHLAGFFFPSLKWSGAGSSISAPWLGQCLRGGHAKYVIVILPLLHINRPPSEEYVVSWQLYTRRTDRYFIAVLKTLVVISCCKVRNLFSVFIEPDENLQALSSIH